MTKQVNPQREYLDSRMSEIDEALGHLDENSEHDLISLKETSNNYVLAYATNQLHIALGLRLETPEDEDLHIDPEGIEALQNRVDELERYLGNLADRMGLDQSVPYTAENVFEHNDIEINLLDVEESIQRFNVILETARDHNLQQAGAVTAIADESGEEVDGNETDEHEDEHDHEHGSVDEDAVDRMASASSQQEFAAAAEDAAESAGGFNISDIFSRIGQAFNYFADGGGLWETIKILFGVGAAAGAATVASRSVASSPSSSPRSATPTAPMRLGEIRIEGPATADNIMNFPSEGAVSDFDANSSNAPNRWYDTPRGVRWYDGEVLLSQSHIKYLNRCGYHPNQGRTIEEFIEQELIVETTFFNGTFRANRELAYRLANAEAEFRSAGIIYNVDNSHTGAYSYRRVSRQSYPYVSNHAFGLAVDFNHNHNDWDSGIIPDYEQQFGRRFEEIMASHGLRVPREWADHEGHSHGDSRDYNADWMHFDIPFEENGLLFSRSMW